MSNATNTADPRLAHTAVRWAAFGMARICCQFSDANWDRIVRDSYVSDDEWDARSEAKLLARLGAHHLETTSELGLKLGLWAVHEGEYWETPLRRAVLHYAVA